MIPVKQTRFGYPHGNCYAACVASLLEIDIADTPTIDDVAQWNEVWDSWFASRGLARVTFSANGWTPKGWCILSGVSARVMFDESGERVHHSCVGLDGELMHDPHPDESFLEGAPTDIDLLYPLNPATLVSK